MAFDDYVSTMAAMVQISLYEAIRALTGANLSSSVNYVHWRFILQYKPVLNQPILITAQVC